MLHGNDLRLRKSTMDDLHFIIRTEQDPDNTPYIVQWPVEKHEAAFHHEDQLHFIVEHRSSGRSVGYVILAGLKNPNKSIELIRITLTEKGRGYGKAVLKLLQQWAFQDLKAHRLWLDVKEHNHRARHVYASVGFVAEGTLRECIKNADSYESLIVMSILETEYKQSE